MAFALKEIVEITQAQCLGTLAGQRIEAVSIDTRTLKPGALYVALKGEKFDGHDFIQEAFRQGAVACLASQTFVKSQAPAKNDQPLLAVPDVLSALQQIARAHRRRFHIPVIAVTGSVGKTSTKEFIHHLLGKKFKAYANQGNFNNHIGLPLSLLGLNANDHMAVFEMGANHAGEVKVLCELAEPSFGVITGVSPSHLKGFGSLDAIYGAKLELADYLGLAHGRLVVNGDDPKLIDEVKKRDVSYTTFGENESCNVKLSQIKQTESSIQFTINDRHVFNLKGHGLFQARNAAAALSMLHLLGFDFAELSEYWKELPVIAKRFQLDKWPRGIRVVQDCYNANPAAFNCAIQSFVAMETTGRRMVIAGDMLELGDWSERYHEMLGEVLASYPIDAVVAIGRYAGFIKKGIQNKRPLMHVEIFADNEKAANYLSNQLKPMDHLLVKGSRALKLETLVESLKLKFESIAALKG